MRRQMLLVGKRLLHGVTSTGAATGEALQGLGCSTSGRYAAPGTAVRFIFHSRPLPRQQAPWMRCFSEQSSQGSGPTGQMNPITFKTMFLTLFAGAGVIAIARSYEDQKLQGMMARSQQVAGKAAVGGPFDLIDQVGT